MWEEDVLRKKEGTIELTFPHCKPNCALPAHLTQDKQMEYTTAGHIHGI